MERLGPTPKFLELRHEILRLRGEYTMSGLLSDSIFDVVDVLHLMKRRNGRIVYLDSNRLISEHYFPDKGAAQEVEEAIKFREIDREREMKAIEILRKRKQRIMGGVFFARNGAHAPAILVYPDSYAELFEGEGRAREQSARSLAYYFLGRVPLNGYVPL